MSWLLLGLLGGLVALDATSFLQVMLSRPLVAALMVGLAFGRPEDTLLLGVVLEAFALVILPIGAARHPEAGIGTVAASGGFLFATPEGATAAALLVAVVFALGWERLAGGSVTTLRRANEWLVRDIADWKRPDLRLERRHRLAMAADFARGSVLALTGAWTGSLLVTVLAAYWFLDPMAALAALGVATVAMLGASLMLFGGWSDRAVALGAGVLVGLLIVLVR